MSKRFGLILFSMIALLFAINVNAEVIMNSKGEYDNAVAMSSTFDAFVQVSIKTTRSKSDPGKPGTVQTVTLTYTVSDPALGFLTWGGDISPNDISGGGGKSLGISTDTCNYSRVEGCGNVSLQWAATDNVLQEWTGRDTTRTGNIVTKTVGSKKLSSATITGSIMGKSFDRGMAQIGTESLSEKQVERVR
jgi:hypothetical protein